MLQVETDFRAPAGGGRGGVVSGGAGTLAGDGEPVADGVSDRVRVGPVRRPPRAAAVSDLWSLRIGDDPAVLYVAERTREGGAVYARWNDPGKAGRERRRARALGLRVRSPDGELDPVLCDEAETRAQALYRTLFPPAPGTPPPGGWLRLGPGLARALATEGAFARNPANMRRTRTYADRLVAAFGPDAAWDALTPRVLRAGWQRMARDAAARTGRVPGVAAARNAFGALFTAARWLRGEGLIPPGAAVPPEGWRAHLASDWRALTGDATTRGAIAPNATRETP